MDQAHLIWNSLLHENVSANGFVDYAGFKMAGKELDRYLEFLSSHPPRLTDELHEQIAYWINAYNAFTIKLIISNYGVTSIKDIVQDEHTSPWKIPFFRIGNEIFSLDRIEHEILRKRFSEPRIHFVLVCASYSCPRLRNEAYTAAQLEKQLEDQTSDFINDSSKNALHCEPVGVSSIFKWYAEDFKPLFADNRSMLQWMNKYANHQVNENASIEYLPYNCQLNGK
ncbi:MAG: DUF547 domain-containing protein [Sediminibacterium sp.]